MLNQGILVGRISSSPELIEKDNKKISKLLLAIPRSYKNVNGEYDTDFINCTLYNGIAESTAEYCKKGDLVGIKGRLENEDIKVGEDLTVQSTQLIAEKVTFLSDNSK